MMHCTHSPKGQLGQFVDVIWCGKADSIELQSIHHAPLFVELIFNYGDRFDVKGQLVDNLMSQHDHQIISGLKTAPFHTTVSGEYRTVGIILKPHCYGLLIRKFGTQDMNSISELLFEHVFYPEQPKFEVVEKHLLDIFSGFTLDADLVKFETHISSEILQKGALHDFNLTLSISQKNFIRKFKKHYHITPSQYAKLKQVNYAVNLLQKLRTENTLAVGLDAGFYDQAHFIKVFKKFCGVTPKQFQVANIPVG